MTDARVRVFLADWPETLAETRSVAASALPVLQWLQPPTPGGFADDVQALLYGMRDCLAWRQTYTADNFGPEFLLRYGWTELIGTRGPVPSHSLACGFLLLGPALEYPSHHHTAEEVYVVLSGNASWRRGGEDWQLRAPGAVIHHPPDMPHAMRTGAEALLALYLWRGGDLAQKSIIG